MDTDETDRTILINFVKDVELATTNARDFETLRSLLADAAARALKDAKRPRRNLSVVR